jgi:acetyl-CoA acetyltransferase
VNDSTPVIIGVGEASEQIDSPAYRALSPADLAGEAVAAALDDALDRATLAPHISVIAAIRQFEVSWPNAVAPFGRADNFPRAVARRIGADPARAILEPGGGQGSQHLINEFARAINAGQTDLVLLCGAEAISTTRHLASRGKTRDWSETIGGQLEDRGFGDLAMSRDLLRHGARSAISIYALFENARRARLGMSGADVEERELLERTDLSRGPASVLAAQLALESAGLSIDDVDVFDFYSCFPIAVFNATDGLGIAPGDPRPLTVTGGHPYFGGAGNNYSMHAIAAMVRRLRAHPSENGLVAANGGVLSKYSLGVYSARPSAWRGFDSKALQAEVDAWPAPPPAIGDGEGVVETYPVDYTGKAPLGIVVGRLNGSQARFVSMTGAGDDSVVQTMIEAEPLGARVEVKPDEKGRSIVRAITPA